MKYFFKRPWFDRVWTFQEICLPRNPQQIPDIICGPYIVPLSTIGAFCRAMSSLMKETQDRIICSNMHQFDQIANTKNLLARPSPRDETEVAQLLLSILQQLYGRNATEAHDFIYGTLGMINIHMLPENLKPHYSRDYGEVYYEYSRFIFERTGCLTLMMTGKHCLQSQPTWVPDFRFLLPQRNALARSKVSFSPDGRKMCVQGFKVGEIAAYIGWRNIPSDLTSAGEALRDFEATMLKEGARIQGISTTAMFDIWLRPGLEVQHRLKNALQVLGALTVLPNIVAQGLISLVLIARGLLPGGKLFGSSCLSEFEREYANDRKCYDYLTKSNPADLPDELNEQMVYINAQVCRPQFLMSSGEFRYHHRRDTTLKKGDIVCFFKGSSTESVLRPMVNGCFSFLGTCELGDADFTQQYGEPFFSRRTVEDWWLM